MSEKSLERFMPDVFVGYGLSLIHIFIGILKGGKDTMTGIVDIAMIGSLYKKGEFHEKINSYGMVIMDECHHAASATAQEILKKINAKYVYGVSAVSYTHLGFCISPFRQSGLLSVSCLSWLWEVS